MPYQCVVLWYDNALLLVVLMFQSWQETLLERQRIVSDAESDIEVIQQWQYSLRVQLHSLLVGVLLEFHPVLALGERRCHATRQLLGPDTWRGPCQGD